jgi:hypothetical protein
MRKSGRVAYLHLPLGLPLLSPVSVFCFLFLHSEIKICMISIVVLILVTITGEEVSEAV